MSADEYKIKKKYKLVAPEGGWGYMIALSSIINLSTSTMFQGSFGLLYKDMLEELDINSTHITLMTGIGSVFGAIAGFLTSTFLKVMSFRMLTFIGAMCLNAGMFGSLFVNSKFTFYLFIGILPYTGVGILLNTSFTILNQYFVERRMIVISFCQTIIALITMLVPMFVKWSLEEYGYHGTLLLVLGITLHSVFGAVLVQPISRHMKKVEIEINEEQSLITQKDPTEKVKPITDITLTDLEGNIRNLNEKSIEYQEYKKPSKMTKLFDTLLDKSLRDTFLMSCVCYGPALSVFADITYNLILPQALYRDKWTQENVALAISLIAFGDLSMRVIFIFIGNWMFKFGSAEVYVAGVILALVARLGTLWTKNFIADMIFITLIGCAHCSIAILIPVVIADAVLPEQFSSAMGISMMLAGLTNLTLGFAIGAVRDLTDSYVVAFYLITCCFAIVALFWLIELCYKKKEHKRQMRREYLKQKKINKG